MDNHGLKERLFVSGSVQRSDVGCYSLMIADIGRNRRFALKEKAEIVRQAKRPTLKAARWGPFPAYNSQS
jgi:hypothetical protein